MGERLLLLAVGAWASARCCHAERRVAGLAPMQPPLAILCPLSCPTMCEILNELAFGLDKLGARLETPLTALFFSTV